MTDESHLEPLRDIATVAHEDSPDLVLDGVKVPRKVLLAVQDDDTGDMVPVGICNLRVERETVKNPSRIWGIPEFDPAVVPWHAIFGPTPKLFLGFDGGEFIQREIDGEQVAVYLGGEIVNVAIFTDAQLVSVVGLPAPEVE